jgi:hypothetical protein
MVAAPVSSRGGVNSQGWRPAIPANVILVIRVLPGAHHGVYLNVMRAAPAGQDTVKLAAAVGGTPHITGPETVTATAACLFPAGPPEGESGALVMRASGSSTSQSRRTWPPTPAAATEPRAGAQAALVAPGRWAPKNPRKKRGEWHKSPRKPQPP